MLTVITTAEGPLVTKNMRGASNRGLAGTFLVCAMFAGGSTDRAAEALAVSSVSSRLQSRSISRALGPQKTLRRRASRKGNASLSSTAVPEKVVTKTTANDATPTTTQEVIPNNMPDALNRFFLGPDRGPICVLGMLTFVATWRLLCAAVTSFDLVVFGGMVFFWCFQEHFIHDKLLHSDHEWTGKEIHENHHKKPYFNISIDPAWLMIAWLATAHGLFRAVLPMPLALSATLGYASAGLVYEWSHYIVHTRVKPPNAFWKRVRDNHIRHHLVDDRYWLSFTLPVVDDIFGTNPSVADVKEEHSRVEGSSSGTGRRNRTTRIE